MHALERPGPAQPARGSQAVAPSRTPTAHKDAHAQTHTNAQTHTHAHTDPNAHTRSHSDRRAGARPLLHCQQRLGQRANGAGETIFRSSTPSPRASVSTSSPATAAAASETPGFEFCCVKERRGWNLRRSRQAERRLVRDSGLARPSRHPHGHQYAGPRPRPHAHPPSPQPRTHPSRPPQPIHPSRPRPQRRARTGLGVRIGPENRCSHYDSDDYPYPQSVEPRIVSQQGRPHLRPVHRRLFRQHQGRPTSSISSPRSEAHDSGLCGRGSAAKKGVRPRFCSTSPWPAPA